MTVSEHKKHARTDLKVGVLTTSDTRTPENDESGQLIRQALESAGHQVSFYAIVPDEADKISTAILHNIGTVDAMVISGGTGIAPRDCTAAVVRVLIDTELPGFGELFRSLSYAEIGPAAYLSRAIAGVRQGKFIALLPGSTDGCRLAMDKLIIPELGHIAWLLKPE